MCSDHITYMNNDTPELYVLTHCAEFANFNKDLLFCPSLFHFSCKLLTWFHGMILGKFKPRIWNAEFAKGLETLFIDHR